MKKILIVLLAMTALVACSRPKEAEQEKLKAQAQEKMEAEREAFNALRMRNYNSEEDLAMRKKMHLQDRFINPKVITRLEVLSTAADIRSEEIERSFIYRRTSLQQCYSNALAFDESLTGRIELGLSIDDNGVLGLANFTSTFEDETLNNCLKNSSKLWTMHRSSKLPKAELSVAIDFSSAPPPTIEEILEKPLKPSDGDEHGHTH